MDGSNTVHLMPNTVHRMSNTVHRMLHAASSSHEFWLQVNAAYPSTCLA